MTDPRTTDQGRHTARARWWAEEFDALDAAAGVVRVDTRNPATIERVARRLRLELANIALGWDAWEDIASDVLDALTEGEKK